MNCTEVRSHIDEFLDGEVDAVRQQTIIDHLAVCPACAGEASRGRTLLASVAALPREIGPSRDLWTGIGPRLAGAGDASRGSRQRGIRRSFSFVAAIAAGVVGFLLAQSPASTPWQVVCVEGSPCIDTSPVAGTGKVGGGQWIETDGRSRARIRVGAIGEVDVGPNSRVGVLETGTTDHRLSLSRGTMHAVIWAPPRVFFVETPSATAIDLGCAYSLAVNDSGTGLLRVTAGYVALEHGGREAIVPAGALCETRPRIGPGTPFSFDASPALLVALEQFDFGDGNADALGRILAAARVEDGITLWHLLGRTTGESRANVFEALARLVPPPPGVTREGILRGETRMLDLWSDEMGLGMSAFRM